jgi:hypothetical protein
MAWDAAQPADNTKIRNLGVVIRANNDAIQTADSTFQPYALNYVNRTTIGPIPDTPATIADTSIMYCREGPVSGNPEIFAVNTTDDVQITSEGRVGSPTTDINAQKIYFGTNTYYNTQRSMVNAWCTVDATGAFYDKHYISTCVRTGTGHYTLVTDAVFPEATANKYCIMLTVSAQDGATTDNVRIANYHTVSWAGNAFTFKVNIANESAALRDAPFSVSIVGGFSA